MRPPASTFLNGALAAPGRLGQRVQRAHAVARDGRKVLLLAPLADHARERRTQAELELTPPHGAALRVLRVRVQARRQQAREALGREHPRALSPKMAPKH